jgi:hypothetical protein
MEVAILQYLQWRIDPTVAAVSLICAIRHSYTLARHRCRKHDDHAMAVWGAQPTVPAL